MSPQPQLPEALSRALEQKQLLIFCGAGISVPPPSYIPSWWSFNNALLEGAKQTVLEAFKGMAGPAMEAIQKLNLEQFTVEAFSHKIVESFAGSSYFPLLKVLESDQTNTNHRAVAELARMGVVRAIVTTNFDTLLERAFREKGLSLQVLAGIPDYKVAVSPEVCTLLKIHGTVSADASLVDTVGQKLRGLGIQMRTRLSEQFRQFHVLVIGFSGADLNFGNDYLALSSIGADSPGLTWLARPGAVVPSRVREVVQAVGEHGCIITADLPGFFERLGIPVEDSDKTIAAGATQKAQDRVRTIVHQFFCEPHIGPFGAAALCSRLLSELGDYAALDSFHETLITNLDSYGDDVPITAMLLFPVLAFHAMHRGRFEEGAKWQARQIKLSRAIIDAQTSDGRQPSAESQLEMGQNLAGAYNNLAIAFLHSGKREEALQYNKEAEQFAADGQSRRLLCRVLLTAAEIAEASGASTDAILEKLRLSRAFALEAGEPATLAETALLEAKALLSVCECDCALSSLRQGRQYFRLQGDLGVKVQAAVHLATIARVRERNAAGLEILKRTRKMCVRLGAGDFAETVVVEEIKLFGMCRALRETLLAEIDSRLPECPSPDDLMPKLREALINGECDTPLQVRVRTTGASAREQKLRENVAKLEGSGEHELLGKLFQQLCHEKYEQRNFSRLADLAQALGAAARRSGSAELKLSALNYVGIAREELGDLPGAQRAYDEILGAQPPPSEEFSAFAKHNRALVGIRLGQLNEAERLLREALRANTARGDYTQAANNIRFLAKIEARRGNITNAIQIIDSSREIIEKAPEKRIAPTIALLRRELEQQRDGVPATLGMERPHTQAAPTNRESFERLRENAKTPSEMGNLGLAALELGLIEDALSLFAEAETGYAKANDQLGVSRCLSNRADAASYRERWQEAIDLGERAIGIRRGLGDIEGQILIGGSLAIWRMNNHQDDAAIEMARKVITQSAGRAPSNSLLQAYVALIVIYSRRKELALAKDAAREFLKARASVENAEGFISMLPEIRKLAEEPPTVAPPIPERSNLEVTMLEAERLQRSNNWSAAIALLDGIDLSKLGDFERARIFATRGNALQTGGEFKKSAAMYAKAAVLFRRLNQESFATQAEHHRAVSLRRLGDRKGAEAQLRSIWANAKEGSLRAAAGQSLVNLLLEKAVELEKPAGRTPELTEARAILKEARDIQGLNDETLGAIETAASNAEWIAGELPSGIALLERAQEHFRRCNSRHVDNCESVLAQRRSEITSKSSNK